MLSGAAKLPNVAPRRPDLARTITLRGARLHTLANVDVSIPLGVLVGVTGVSGSGKSSLIDGTLVPAMRASIAARGASTAASPHLGALEGAAAIDRLIAIDQQPLGRSSRSSAATYTGIMDPLRQHFAALPEAKARGYTASRFSFNARGGRCEACRGEGVVRVSMAFLPDVLVPCEMCGGARFDRATLEVKHRGRSIADVLALPVDDALLAFDTIPAIADRLRAMQRVGLGYLRIGQPSSTLSGGEAQRVKLATELAKASKGARDRTLYLLDEPTTGLHPSDVVVLLEALVALRDAGSSVVVIEHDMDVVARLDWVIDLGPHAGAEGGHIVAAGTPDEVARSHGPTAAPLAAALARLRG